MMMERTVMVLLLLALAQVVRATRVVSPTQFASTTFSTPALGFARGSPAIAAVTNATVLKFDESWCTRCRGAPAGTALDGAVLFQNFYSEKCFVCGYGKVAVMARDAGAGAVLWYSAQEAGHEVFVFQSRSNWNAAAGFPFLEISSGDVERLDDVLKAAGASTTVTLALEEAENPWVAFYAGPWIAVQVICSLLALVVLWIGGRRLWHFGRRYMQEGQYQVAVAVLTIECVNNTLRLVSMAVDPAWSREIFPYGVGRMFITISIPIGLMSAVLLFLAWNDMLTSSYSVKASVFRSRRSQIIFFSVGVVFLGADLTITLLAAVEGRVSLSMFAAIIEAVFSLVVGAGILIVGTRLLRTLSQFTAAPSAGAMNNNASSSKELSSYNNTSSAPEDTPQSSFNTATQVESVNPSSGKSFTLGSKTPRVRKEKSKISGGSAASRANKDERVRRLTTKIRLMALFLLLSAVVIGVGGQDFMIFGRTTRAITFVLFYATQTARSYFTISFFEPTPRRAPSL